MVNAGAATPVVPKVIQLFVPPLNANWAEVVEPLPFNAKNLVVTVFVVLAKVKSASPANVPPSLNWTWVSAPAATTEEALIPVMLVLDAAVNLPLASTVKVATWEPEP